MSKAKKVCKEWISNLVDWKKILTEETKELNITKTKLEYRLFQIASLYSMKNTLLWFQKRITDEKECFKPTLNHVQVELPKNESTAYQESTFWLLPTKCLTFRQIWNPTYWKDEHSCTKIVISCMNMCSITSATEYLHLW